MINFDVNYLAILVAAVAGLVVGSVWYSPILFGREWVKLMGWTKARMLKRKKQGVGEAYLLSFIGSLIAAFVIAQFVELTGATTIREGVQVAALAWLGFAATAAAADYVFAGKTVKLYLINYLFHLVAFAVMGAILAIWV